jgi:hypothetical protein
VCNIPEDVLLMVTGLLKDISYFFRYRVWILQLSTKFDFMYELLHISVFHSSLTFTFVVIMAFNLI